MTFWRCYYHVVWAAKNREPLITSEREPFIFGAIERKSVDMGCQVLAINAAFNHIHVAVMIPPTLTIADWVKNVKGVSSHEANAVIPNADSRFRWQNGFSVHTFGEKNLPLVSDYIRRQKEHHGSGKLFPNLEQIED